MNRIKYIRPLIRKNIENILGISNTKENTDKIIQHDDKIPS